MNPVLRRFLVKTVGGAVLLVVGVPIVQGQQMSLSTSVGPALRVSGDIARLSPGTPGHLVLTVANDGGADAVVAHLSAVPAQAVAGCAITIEPWVGRLAVPARGTATQALTVTVSGAHCSGAKWRLDYTAQGAGA